MIDLHRSTMSRGAVPLFAVLLAWLVLQNTLFLLGPAGFSAAPFVVLRALLRVAAALATRYPLLFGLLFLNGAMAVWIGVALWRSSGERHEEES